VIADIAVIARNRKGKTNTHHGGAETRRKGKNLPQIDADARGSEKTAAN